MSITEETKKKKRNKSKKLNKISFQEETVPKDAAKQLLQQHEAKVELENVSIAKKQKKEKKKRKKQFENNLSNNKTEKQKRKHEYESNPQNASNISVEDKPQSKKRKRNADKISTSKEAQNELDPTKPVTNKEESNRKKKKMKLEQVLSEKKSKSELDVQQKCLNYLSLWKHCREQWKFEKLRQIWLQQNLYDAEKIPEQFWETLVEYFSNSKGKAKRTIIDEAIKVIEGEEKDENEANDKNVKLERARNIIQCLNE